ncbi:MAG TPA: efflux RND transporter permease subunit [Pseudomonadota bacterium]|nr:efflux RND transporter permease subunit [Pseudomonadota bacterium]
MWIVELALRRPYTVAVMSLLILLLGVLSVTRMVVDIFPAIDIPVVAVVWNYPGLSAEDMERRVVLLTERGTSTTVNGVERIESQSIPGVGLVKVYFHPDTSIAAAIAQLAAITSTLLRQMPPGMTPPQILQFNASNVPVAQLTSYSSSLPEEKIFDYNLNFVRIRLFTIPGLSTPAPFGGKGRQVSVDIDPQALSAKGLSAADVVTALQAENLILPAGSARIADREYSVVMNSSPSAIEQFGAIPIKVVGGRMVTLGDVARVSDGFADQTNIVHVNGRRATYLAILKHADASTLAVVDAAREAMPAIKAAAPSGLDFRIDFDQSVFVRGAIKSVLREALLSSALVSLMIGLFLGSWRSMVIVCTSIPLAICSALVGLKLTGHSINIMTLGGLALAIGMLVDDATVEVENIHRNRHLGKGLTVAILDGAEQIAVPAIVATLAICIVFFPVVLLFGPAKFLFVPLALAVVLAMLASYLLSRTLVPVLARLLMAGEHDPGHGPPRSAWARLAHRFNTRRDAAFERFVQAYGRLLELLLAHPGFTVAVAAAVAGVSLLLALVVGTDFFPSVDAGLMKLHFRAPPGTRLERTEQLVNELEAQIREVIPPAELVTVNSMIGVPLFYNLAFVPTDNVSAMDADILIALGEHHHPTQDYLRALRRELPRRFPGSTFYFQPADIISQVLNFGLSAPLDIQIEYPNLQRAFEFARTLRDRVREVPGTADVHIVQMLDYPTLRLDVDRQQAAQLGLSQRDVASSVLISLSASSLLAPSFFLNPQNNVNYTVVVKAPLGRLQSVPDLLAMPLTPPSASALWQPAEPPGATPTALPQAPAQTLGGLAVLSSQVTPDQINHHTVQRVLDIQANLDGRDLGAVARDIERKIAGLGPLPTGMRIHVRGQNEVMQQSFRSLGLGLVLAIVLVYFLMVVLFQSWLDPFIIMIAVPGALVGILWMLALTGTTINVESLMGAIMAVGIAVSNSILMVSFANDSRLETELTAAEAALLAGKTRLRPVLMTALAMIIGMIPMALALGEAGEQNAPLGRAVIGGLLVATGVTLFVVPVVYALLRRALPEKQLLEARFLAERQGASVARGHRPARHHTGTGEPAGAAAMSQIAADVEDKE